MVANNEKIIYSSIINQFLDWIKSTCQNIDTYADTVPDSAKEGYTFKEQATEGTGGANITIDSSSVIPVITTDSIKTELSSFLSSVGMLYKDDYPITLKGALKLWNCLASFASTKVVVASGLYCPTPIIMYKSSNESFVVGFEEDNLTKITDAEIYTDTDKMFEVLKNNAKVHKFIYNISAFSCSSSSSSCSSSSSSSYFIAYTGGLQWK